jgi:signal transduction histidine kinase
MYDSKHVYIRTCICIHTDRGFRGKTAVESKMPGSGLGLHIVRELIAAVGGTLEFEQVRGGGLRVRVTLLRKQD